MILVLHLMESKCSPMLCETEDNLKNEKERNTVINVTTQTWASNRVFDRQRDLSTAVKATWSLPGGESSAQTHIHTSSINVDVKVWELPTVSCRSYWESIHCLYLVPLLFKVKFCIWITEISHLKSYTSILNSSIPKRFWSLGLGSYCCCSRSRVSAITNWKWQRSHAGSKCEDSCCYLLAGQSHVFHRLLFAPIRSLKLFLCLSKNTSDWSTWNEMESRGRFPIRSFWWIYVMWHVQLLFIWLNKLKQNKKSKFAQNDTLEPTKHKSNRHILHIC